jgi:4-amino-4-deoxy-L-arabinose transferase-like glycosyltransferase
VSSAPVSADATPSATLPLVALLAAALLGASLSGYRFLDPDEGRNGEIAREMMESNDYVVPHLNGLPYLDKPIVYFAAAAAAMELLGPTERAARLPAWVFTLVSLVIVGLWARRRWGPDAGWLVVMALATMPLVSGYSRTVIFDSALAACVTAAVLWLWDGRPRLAWTAIGVGVLVKGPIAIAIPLLAVVPAALVTGRGVRPLFPVAGLAAFFAVTLPWFIAVSLRHPEFPRYVFVEETFQRVTTGRFHRYGPPWYYLPILLVGAFPWVVPALARVRAWRATWQARRVDAAAADAVLLASWVLVPLAFLTLNQSKLPQYLLPLFPAVALAATANLTRHGHRLGWRPAAALLALLGTALVTLPWWLPAPLGMTPETKNAIPPTAAALGGAAIAAGVLLALAARRLRPALGGLAYALPVLTVPFISGDLMRAVGNERSAARLAAVVAGALETAAGDPASGDVLAIAVYPPSLPFYLGRQLPVATATGAELTSNWIAARADQYRTLPGSPLLPADAWRDALSRCPRPTVFVTRAGEDRAPAELRAALPMLAVEGRYAAYGPCRPGAP